jgi:hypothetical protein
MATAHHQHCLQRLARKLQLRSSGRCSTGVEIVVESANFEDGYKHDIERGTVALRTHYAKLPRAEINAKLLAHQLRQANELSESARPFDALNFCSRNVRSLQTV